MRKARTILLITVVSLILTVVLAEIGLRLWLDASGTQEQKVMYLYSVEEIRALETRLLYAPYVSYLPNPDYDGHNALGYRGEEVTIPKPEGVFRIVALGGSTTYSTGTSAEESYPALLQKTLREQYGLSQVEVVNAGFIGYTSWESLATFAFRALELEPDMVIYYEGVNDLVVRENSTTDCYAGQNAMRGLNPVRGLFVERTPTLPGSVLYRLIAIPLGWMPNPLALDSSFEPTLIPCDDDPGDMTLERRLETNTPRYLVRNVRSIMQLAAANGAQPVLTSWLYDVNNAERPPLWRAQIALQNEALRGLASELDAPYIDLTTEYPADAALWEADGVHMLAGGTQAMAELLAAALMEAGLIP